HRISADPIRRRSMSSPPAKRARDGSYVPPVEDNCIRFVVQRPKEVTFAGMRSPEKMIAGFPWTLSACHRIDPEQGKCFGVFLRCEMAKSSAIWFCNTTFELRIVNQTNPARDVKREMSYRFSCTSSGGYGTPNWVEFSKVMDPAEGYFKDEVLVVEARITVESDHGSAFRSRFNIDFDNPSEISDMILKIEEKQVYVSKQFLAAQSSYFRSLFFRDFKESRESIITLEDVKWEAFTALLKVLYRTAQLSDMNVESIISLADRFDIKTIVDEVELFLMSNEKVAPEKKLRIADEYRLMTLKGSAVDHYDVLHKIDYLVQSVEFPLLSKELTDVLFKKYVKLTKELAAKKNGTA
ncbi:hypothetical protein PFISCL1PPCAC_8774, partial [Pristionchus fissidentatus]